MAIPAPTASVEEIASRAIQQLALLELRLQESPSPADYQIALATLRLAKQFTPDDVELTRKIAAAAWGTGEHSELISATRNLLQLDPSDTVAQLRLITATIGKYQTAEERLAAYERFLGPGGEKIDASVRSRLAVDAALLYREQGDEQKFVDTLNKALSLDGSNKTAAQLAVTFYNARVQDLAGQLEMELNLLYADPLDPNVHLSIAQQLADNGVLDQAQRFHQNAVQLFSQAGQTPPTLETQVLALRWQTAGPQAVVDALNKLLAAKREPAKARYDAGVAANLPPDQLIPPEQVRLEPEEEMVRIAAAIAAGDEQTKRTAVSDLAASFQYASMQFADPKTRPANFTNEQIVSMVGNWLVQLQTYRLWADLDRDKVDAELKAVREQGGEQYAGIQEVLEPWLALRDGRYQDAIDAAERSGVRMARLTRVAEALAYEKLGQAEQAASMLFELARSDGLSPVSAWARGYASKLAGSDSGVKSEFAPRMRTLAAGVPDYIDRMISNPSSFMSLQIDAVDGPLYPEDPFTVTLRLRNLAPIPLGVGSDRPLNSRFLLQPHRDNSATYFFNELFPEVLELNRRLRLEPLESVEATVPVDVGASGLVLSLNSLNNHRVRWRALQGFVLGGLNTFQPGPVCLSAESKPVEVRANPIKQLSAQEFGVAIRSGGTEILPLVLDECRSVLMAWPMRTPRPETTDATIREAVTARFQAATPIERVLMLAKLPPSRVALAMTTFDESAQALPSGEGFRATKYHDIIESLVLLTRVTDPGSSVLDDAIEHGSPAVAELAQLVRARLAEGRPCFARLESPESFFPQAFETPN